MEWIHARAVLDQVHNTKGKKFQDAAAYFTVPAERVRQLFSEVVSDADFRAATEAERVELVRRAMTALAFASEVGDEPVDVYLCADGHGGSGMEPRYLAQFVLRQCGHLFLASQVTLAAAISHIQRCTECYTAADITPHLQHKSTEPIGLHHGCTLTVTFVAKHSVAVAFLGDSQVFLASSRGERFHMTPRHRIDAPIFAAYARRKGAHLHRKHRLAASASADAASVVNPAGIGDNFIPGVHRILDVRTYPRRDVGGGALDTLIISTDGLWDAVGPDEALAIGGVEIVGEPSKKLSRDLRWGLPNCNPSLQNGR